MIMPIERERGDQRRKSWRNRVRVLRKWKVEKRNKPILDLLVYKSVFSFRRNWLTNHALFFFFFFLESLLTFNQS